MVHELDGTAVVGSDGGGEGAFVEELVVHLDSNAVGIGCSDKEDEGDAAAAAAATAREAVLEEAGDEEKGRRQTHGRRRCFYLQKGEGNVIFF